MLSFLYSKYINNFIFFAFCACFILSDFSLASTEPTTVHEAIFYNDLAKAAKKLQSSSRSKKSIKALLHLKKLIEEAYETKINVECCLLGVQRYASHYGFEISQEELLSFSKLLKIKKFNWLPAPELKDNFYPEISKSSVMGMSCLLGVFFLRYVPLCEVKVLSDDLTIAAIGHFEKE